MGFGDFGNFGGWSPGEHALTKRQARLFQKYH